MIQEQVITEQPLCFFGWSAWSSILAGVVTAIAVSMVMAMFGMALNFAVVDPMSNDPMAGMGWAFGIWSVISVIVSLAGGGFVAGMLAGRRGLMHGFLVWALVLFIGAFFSGIAVSSAVKMLGSAVGAVGSGAADMATTMGKASIQAVTGAFSELEQNMSKQDVDTFQANIDDVLRDTGIPTLQPGYLKQQMREAGSNLRKALYQLSLNPSESDQILSAFLDKEKARLQSLSQNVDKEAAVNALVQARDIPRPEAEMLVDNALRAYNQGLNQIKATLNNAQEQVQEAQAYLKDMAAQARKGADAITSAVSGAALAAGIALIVGALITMYAGAYGVRHAARRYGVRQL